MTRQVDSDSVTLSENETYNSRLTWNTSDTEPGEYTVTVQGDNDSYSFTTEVNAESGVSRWTFDNADTDTGTAIDVWGSNDGTINGATTGVTGANQTYATNEAYSFDGTDDLVTIPSFSKFTSYTVSVWTKCRSPTDADNDLVVAIRDSNNGIIIQNRQTGNFTFFQRDGSGTFQQFGSVTNDTNWKHGVITWDGSTAKAYVNAKQTGEIAISTISGDGIGNAIGSRADGANYLDGLADDVRIYNKALTPTEVSNLYNTGFIQ